MNKRSNIPWLLGVTAVVSLLVGHFVGRDSTKVDRLRNQIAMLESSLAEANARPIPVPPVRPGALNLQIATNNDTNATDWATRRLALQREQKEAFRSNWLAHLVAGSSEEYATLFSNLGLTPDDSARFMSNLVTLYKGAMDAGDPLGELMTQRYRYDEAIRKALGDEKYTAYRNFEESKPAVREYKQFEEFAATNRNLALDPAYTARIVELIKEAGATTTESWHGPYDPPPRPIVGPEHILKHLAKSNDEIRTRSASLLERINESDLPNGYAELIRDYYAAKIQENLSFAEVVSIPEEQAIADSIREINEHIAKRDAQGQR